MKGSTAYYGVREEGSLDIRPPCERPFFPWGNLKCPAEEEAMYYWTPRTTARAELADLLLKHLPEAQAAGLTEEDLQGLSAHGHAAATADRVQKAELAQNVVERAARSEAAHDLFAREDALRARLPAVLGALGDSSDPAQREQGRWLGALSFARYHLRSVPAEAVAAAAAAGGEAPVAPQVLKSVERVPRADFITRFNGLSAFCQALLAPERAPIVELLAARGLSAKDLKSLGEDAQALADQGRNQQKAAAHTAVESNEVAAQQLIWHRVRRMVRIAVRGVRELEQKYAEC
jgi:hypothetical protein